MVQLRYHSDADPIKEETKEWKGYVCITERSRSKLNSSLLKSSFIIYTLLPSKMDLRGIKWQTHHRASCHYLSDIVISLYFIPAEVFTVQMLMLYTGHKERSSSSTNTYVKSVLVKYLKECWRWIKQAFMLRELPCCRRHMIRRQAQGTRSPDRMWWKFRAREITPGSSQQGRLQEADGMRTGPWKENTSLSRKRAGEGSKVCKGNLRGRENTYKSTKAKDSEVYWETTRNSGYMQEVRQEEITMKRKCVLCGPWPHIK